MLFARCRLHGVTIVIDQTLRLPPKIVGGRRLDVMRWGKEEINDNGYERVKEENQIRKEQRNTERTGWYG